VTTTLSVPREYLITLNVFTSPPFYGTQTEQSASIEFQDVGCGVINSLSQPFHLFLSVTASTFESLEAQLRRAPNAPSNILLTIDLKGTIDRD
jgi:hypothetical protein